MKPNRREKSRRFLLHRHRRGEHRSPAFSATGQNRKNALYSRTCHPERSAAESKDLRTDSGTIPVSGGIGSLSVSFRGGESRRGNPFPFLPPAGGAALTAARKYGLPRHLSGLARNDAFSGPDHKKSHRRSGGIFAQFSGFPYRRGYPRPWGPGSSWRSEPE